MWIEMNTCASNKVLLFFTGGTCTLEFVALRAGTIMGL
jgi:hypothetical protein